MKSSCLIAALAAPFIGAVPALAEIRRDDFRVTVEPGIELFVRELRDMAVDAAAKPPVVLLHGARVPGIASFDLPVASGSLAVDLARAGHRVFVMDARGYGGSSRPGQDGPPDGLALTTSHEVVRDLDAVVGAVATRTGNRHIALLGWATGGHWAGMYAALHPERVSHLVIYNALYGAHAGHPMLGPESGNADPADRSRFASARFGAYRLNTAASLMPSWNASIPSEDKAQWRDPAVAEAYQCAALASDPNAAARNPAAFRAPSGAIEDSFYLASGRQLWDAASITANVLIIRSGNDFWSRPEDVTGLESRLVRAARVTAVTIPEATHFVHLDRPERGRDRFLSEVVQLLGQPADDRRSSPR